MTDMAPSFAAGSGYYGPAPRAASQARLEWTICLFMVMVMATVHNFAGVFAAIAYGVAVGEVRNGRLRISGFAGAFWLVAIYAAIRLALPSQVDIVAQTEEVIRFAAIAMFAASLQRHRIREMMNALTLFLFLMLALLPLSFVTDAFSIVDASGVRRFAGLMPHANHLGYVAAVTAVGLIYLRERSGLGGAQLWATILCAFLLVIITRSSGSLIVIVLGMAMLPISLKPTAKRMVITVALVAVIVGLMLSPYGQFVIEKISVVDVDSVVRGAQIHNFGNQGSSFGWRLSYWIALLNSLIEQGTLKILFGEGGAATTLDQAIYYYIDKDPHSDLVKVFVEYGAIGFVVIFTAILRAGWSSRATFIGLAILIGPMLAGNSLTSPSVMFVMLTVLAILSASAQTQRKLVRNRG